MKLIDTHAHIYAGELAAGLDLLMEKADKAGIINILMPAIDRSTHAGMLEVEQRYPGSCISMMGLHPCSVKGDYQQELDVIQGYLEQRKFVAIGETGLDFYWDLTFKEQQYVALDAQVAWAKQYDVPIVIHSRNSTDECIERIRVAQDGSLKGVFHCFSGNEDQARQLMDLGFYMGIGGVVTFKNSGLDRVVKAVGLERLVLETDAPYLAPVPHRGKRNEPSYLSYVVQKMAEITGLAVEEVGVVTTANAQKLFGL